MSTDARRDELLQAVEALREELARLSHRVEGLERSAPRLQAPAGSVSTTTRYGAPVTDEALICVISAAVAAYLGVQPRIRQIRLIGGGTWAQQGRVTLQASHAFSIRHG